MSMIIRRPVPGDRKMKSASIDISHYNDYDRNHVKECFTTVAAGLQSRLGNAITKLRQQLIYRQRHHEALARLQKKLDVPEMATILSTEGKQQLQLEPMLREATSHPGLGRSERSESRFARSTQATTFAEPQPESVLMASSRDYDAGTEISYGTTVQSPDEMAVPPCPVDLGQGVNLPFECPYCRYIVEMKNTQQRRYVS